jgi:acetyl esterase
MVAWKPTINVEETQRRAPVGVASAVHRCAGRAGSVNCVVSPRHIAGGVVVPIHPQTLAVLDIMAQMGVSIGGNLSDLRALMASFPRPEGESVGAVVNRTVPGPAGEVPVRIYSPACVGSRRLPALVWFHGGGWVFGSLDSADFVCRRMANRAGCHVISVEYRLAPEAKFPAAVDDCFAVTKWIAHHAADLDVDAERIAVGGDSCGGNLAAVVAQLARDQGGPPLAFQVLVYPVTNHSFDTASYRDYGDGYFLTRDAMVWFWNHYLEEVGDGNCSLASPLRATTLAGLPPAIVITAEFDPLRDDAEAYAARLRADEVTVELVRYDSQIHGFFGNAMIDDGISALDYLCAALQTALTESRTVQSV